MFFFLAVFLQIALLTEGFMLHSIIRGKYVKEKMKGNCSESVEVSVAETVRIMQEMQKFYY